MPKAAQRTSARKDPTPRMIDASAPYFNLLNKDPGMRYVWVYKAAVEFGPEYYEGIGYEPVQHQEGGPRPRVGKPLKNGQFVESRGHILMACTAERGEELYLNGEDGNSGQNGADRLARRMKLSGPTAQKVTQGIPLQSSEGSDYFEIESEKGSISVGDSDG